MDKKVVPLKPEMKPDLEGQKTSESDSLNKAENPDTTYMKSNRLCSKCHGRLTCCADAFCPQRGRA